MEHVSTTKLNGRVYEVITVLTRIEIHIGVETCMSCLHQILIFKQAGVSPSWSKSSQEF